MSQKGTFLSFYLFISKIITTFVPENNKIRYATETIRV